MSEREIYLGDGLFASFDGYQVKLRAPRENGDHEVLSRTFDARGVHAVSRRTPDKENRADRTLGEESKMKYLIVAIAMTILIASSSAQAGTCEDAMARYSEDVAKDNAADTSGWAPGAKEANDKLNERIKANILKGRAPGGFYDQLDEAIRGVKAKCKAHPNTKGC